MSRQEKVKDNSVLGYFSKEAIISSGMVILQDGTSENDFFAHKWLKLFKSACLAFKVETMCL